MANDLSNPVNATVSAKQSGDGFFDHGSGSDSLFGGVQLAQAEGGATPPVPGQTIHVNPPQDAAGPVVIRVEVAPGSIVELPQPFDADAALAAKEGDGNLAIRVGDITVILQGYIQADNDPQHPVTIEGADGKPIDVATILASTDPAIDIQTAAGPGDTQGGQGADNTGAILAQLDGGSGLGGFEGAGAQDQTQLGYSLIDGSLRQEFAQSFASPAGFSFSIGQSLGLGHESSLRDPAQVDSLDSYGTFLHEYQDAVEHPGAAMFAGWADFQGTGVTGESFKDYLDQTSKTTKVDVHFTGATGDLVLTGIADGVTSNGSHLSFTFADGGHTMFIRRDEATATDTGNALVAVVHVDGPDANGEFTIQTILINRLDHPDAGKDTMDMEIQFKVYDGPAPTQSEFPNEGGENGDGPPQQTPTSPSIEGSITASFDDDVPILESVTYQNQHDGKVAAREAEGSGSNVGLIDEDWLHGGSKDQDTNTTGDTGGGTCVTGSIKVNFGADGAALSDGATEDHPDKHAFELNTTTYHLGQDFPYGTTGLSSGGQPLVVLSVGPDHLTVGIEDSKQQRAALEGEGTPSEPKDPIPGQTIFTLTLNQATGQFEFDLKGPLDHGTPSDTIFGDDSGLNALTVEAPAPAGGTEETISLAFGVTATDDDGDTVQAEIDIDVNDDVPIARNDTDHVDAGSHAAISGNVITAAGEDSVSGKDSQGGDHAHVTGVAAGSVSVNAGAELHGEYGKLTLNADGSYTYVRDAYSKGGVDDVFTYTLTDGDGDTSQATLTIHIGDAGVCIALPSNAADTTVDEAGLPARGAEPAGSDAASDSEKTGGTVTITAKDGIQSLEIAGHELSLNDLKDLGTTPFKITDSTGELTLTGFNEGTGALSYTYVLKDNTSGEGQSADFEITVKDVDGDEKTATLSIKIVDDAPTANCDEISVVAGRTADIQFIVDVSGSMKDSSFSVPGTYPDNGIGLERYAMAQMLAAHPEVQNVQFVLFSDHSSHSVWMTATAALTYLQNNSNFPGGGNTDYDKALTEAMGALGSAKPLPQGDQTLVYFFSDGDPNEPKHNEGIDSDGSGANVSQSEWQTFVDKHGITNVFTVGIGNVTSGELAELTPISYPNIDTPPANHEDNFVNLTNSTVTTLVQTLNGLVSSPSPSSISGDVTDNDVPGADDFGTGKLVSVSYAGTPHVFDSTTHQFTLDLGAGRGTLVINDDGSYTYTPPAGKADGTPFSVDYTIQDGDGDTATAKLKIDLQAAPEVDLDTSCDGNNATASFVEDQVPPALIAPSGIVSDAGTIGSMTVTLTNRPDGNAIESLGLNGAAGSAASTAGLTVAYNSATGALTITGSAAASVYQTVLQGIQYNNTSQNPNGTDRTVTVSVKDEEATPLSSITHIVTVSVTAVNDAPTADIAPASFTIDEQTDLTLSGKIASQFNMVIGDVDAADDQVSVTLTVTEGKLTVDAGNSHVDSVSGSGTSTVTIKGSIAEINNLLGGIDTGNGSAGSVKYRDDTDTPSSSPITLTLKVNDQGQNGIGGAKTAQDTASIIVIDTNDKPVTDLNGASSGSDVSRTFIEQTAVLIAPSGTVKDDSGSVTTMTVTLTNRPDGNSVESLSLNAAAQLAATGLGVGYNSATGTLTITGPATTAVYQSILQGILYNNSSDTPNTAHRTVTVVVKDAGNLTSDSHSVDISVTPVNDAPTADITTNFTVNEQTDLNLSGKLAAQFNMLVNDVDSAGDNISVTLSVTEGKITVDAGNSGVDILSGNSTGSVTVRGSLAEINNLLHEIDTGNGSAGTVKYKDDTNTPSSSPVTLTLLVNDDGQNGSGGALTATDTATITVNNTNDKPVTDLNGGSSGSDCSVSFIEQTAVKIAPSGTVTDDSGKISSMTVTLTNRPDGNSVESLSLNSTADAARIGAGLSVTYTAATGVLLISGPQAAASVYQTILQGILYNDSSDTPNTTHRSVTVAVNDGLLNSDSHSIDISVTPVNDAPTADIAPVSFTVNEQTELTLSGKIGAQFNMLIGDVDAGNDTVTVTLSVGKGTLTIDEGNSGADVWSGNGSSTVVIKGSVTEINNLFKEIDTGAGSAGSVTYFYDSDSPSPSTTLKLQVNDNGENGTGGALTASDTAVIYITDTPEAPIACDDNVITNAGSNTFSIPDWALTYNDSDSDTPNSGLSLPAGDTAVLYPSGGTAHHPGDVTFADNNGSGSSSFDYKVTDGALTDIGHVKVTQDTSGDLNGSNDSDIVVVYGSTGTTVDAAGGDDIVIGGGGNDKLDGGAGTDLIFGGGGNDSLVYFSDTNSGHDKYDGGSGFDRLQVTGSGHVNIDYATDQFKNIEMIDLGDATNRSGSSNQNEFALNAADLGVSNNGTVGTGGSAKQISLFVIGDESGNSTGKDVVDLHGFSATSTTGNFTDTSGTHNFTVYSGLNAANQTVHVAIETGLIVHTN